MKTFLKKITSYFNFATTIAILTFFQLFSLQKISIAQEEKKQINTSLNYEIGAVLYNSQLAGYKLNEANQQNYEKENISNYKFGLSYAIKKRYNIGISLITNNLSEFSIYENAKLIGTNLYNETTQTYSDYTITDKSLKINDKYIALKLNYLLIDAQRLKICLGSGISLLHLKQEFYDYNRYGNYTELFNYTTQSVAKNTLGVELTLDASIQLSKILSLSLSPTYIYSPQEASPLYPSNFQYFSLIGKASFNLAKENFTGNENPRNTIMFSIGFPISVSYEYQLAKNKGTHSLRGYLANYLFFETFPGIAYNIKFGKDKFFFISELNTILRHGISIGPNIGVERQTQKLFVYRFTVGAIFKQKAISDASEIILPHAEFHLGRSF